MIHVILYAIIYDILCKGCESDMRIGSIGYNYSHNGDFVMDRPEGNGCCLLLLIKTNAHFTINGEEQDVKAGSFIIFTYDTPCRYCASGDTYTDDWCYISADDEDMKRIEQMGIPLNKIVWLGNIDELSQLIHMMSYEHYSAEGYHTEIEHKYLDIFFMRLSRILTTRSSISSRSFIEKNARMTQIRAQIYSEPENISGVDELAESAGMSRSGFQHLYKKMFGISVISDIINSRIDCAKRMLATTTLPLSKISERCGYNNVYSFMRQFKERVGKTPTEYRNGIL